MLEGEVLVLRRQLRVLASHWGPASGVCPGCRDVWPCGAVTAVMGPWLDERAEREVGR